MTTATCNGAFPHDARSAAELYLAAGLAPIPLPPRSKDPGYQGWQRLRLGPADLDQHFPRQQDRNLGVLNGRPSRNQADADLDTDEARRAGLVLLPPTGWRFGRSSAPRAHWVYQTDTPLDTAAEQFKDLDGTMLVELRGTGGHTLFPPSIHPSGEPITWDLRTEPASVALADLRRAVAAVASATLLARHWPAEGSRQDAALALAGGLARAGWDVERVEKFLTAVVQASEDDEPNERRTVVEPTLEKLKAGAKLRGWPSLAEIVGDDVVQRARGWLGMTTAAAGKAVRQLPAYRPFPVCALPGPVAEYARQGAAALGCDPSFVSLPILAAAASLVGNTRTIRLKAGWEEPCVLWSVIVGDSGTLKSPAYLKAVAHLFRLQRQLLDDYKAAKTRYEEELADYKAAKKKAKEEGTDPGDPPEAPVMHRVACSDTTIEKLAEILEDNPRGTLVARDELAAWLGSFCRYKGRQGGSDLPNWLEMFRAGTVVVDRKTGDRPTLFVHRAAVSVCGGIQPGVLARALSADFLDAGLAARLLMAWPPKQPKQWTECEIEPDVEKAYHDLLDRLAALDFRTLEGGEKCPHVLALSPEGKAAWVSFYDDWAQEQAAVEGELAACFSKLEAYAARLALLHHVLTHVALDTDDRRPVGPRSVEAGVALARWFGHEARRIYATLTETAEERDTRRLVEFLQARGGRATVKELMRSNNRKYPTAGDAESSLDTLVQAGLARWEERPPGPKGGRPSRSCVLCMTHDETDETSPDGDGGDAGSRDETPDQTPAPPDDTPGFPGPDGVSSVSSCVMHDSCPTAPGPVERAEAPVVSSGGLGGFVGQPWRLITEPADLDHVLRAVDASERVGLDTETTGLDPHADRLRLLSLATPRGVFLVDCFAVDPRPLFGRLAEKLLVGHNLHFDLGFLAVRGFEPGRVRDTLLLSRLLYGTRQPRGFHELERCAGREVGKALDKTKQRSCWAGTLDQAQLDYAATDAAVTLSLCEALDAKVREAGLTAVVNVESRCLPAMIWLARSGVGVSRDGWLALSAQADAEAQRLAGELDVLAPAPDQPGFFSGWNWDSPEQVKEVFHRLGVELVKTDDETLAAVEHPLADLLRRYRAARKGCTTYGPEWLKHVAADGRVYASWNQLGSDAGRMSCSRPNLQQLPRGAHRRCIQAPLDRVLVKADYSQIELRIAAEIAGEKAILDAYARGEDLHRLTAQRVLGVADVTREQRQLAKAVNFGLLYGMRAKGLRKYARSQYGLELTEPEAWNYRRAFFKSYPGLAAWHQRVEREHAAETRTLAGRRRLIAEEWSDTLRLNSPVQGTGADGLKLALALLWERREECPGAFPVLAVHDEIVVECAADQAEAASGWLRQAMLDGMQPWLKQVPVEVEVRAGRTWGGD